MTAANCPTCDREECDRPAAADATAGIPGFGEDCTDEDNAKWSRLGFAVRNCLAHAVTADQWRARALAAEADAARWRKVAPLIERLRVVERYAWDGPSNALIDALDAILAATQEPTP